MLRVLCKVFFLEEYDCQTCQQFEGLWKDDSRGCDVHATTERTWVSHAENEDCILYSEHQKTGILQRIAPCIESELYVATLHTA